MISGVQSTRSIAECIKCCIPNQRETATAKSKGPQTQIPLTQDGSIQNNLLIFNKPVGKIDTLSTKAVSAVLEKIKNQYATSKTLEYEEQAFLYLAKNTLDKQGAGEILNKIAIRCESLAKNEKTQEICDSYNRDKKMI